MKYLLDTNVFREMGKTQGDSNATKWLGEVDDCKFYISSLTVLEIWKGVERLRTKKPEVAADIEHRIEVLFEEFKERIISITPDIARTWGQLLAQSEKHINDTGLAATAKVHNMILVTRNVKDVKGRNLRVLDPYTKSPKIIDV
ncbi:hypothetical protein A7D16_19900 [Xanthomonas nasturtii]|uniref:type II toxin-antitoxin system VapC family toxin n=1 Tax=Xanthomonas nasturtii TaxID=1843581 RepID=UPI0007E2FF02|nr:type II toxin-antitoxin system VapC family toxin [Xanthomonas nasturtii]OAX86291.1 hypothetical protein A7D16_19900 [Xanthomonas nasturtii]WVL58081.1 type II toxin-antitoxin system VapC family toxin [Xanthomonas nasturtii]